MKGTPTDCVDHYRCRFRTRDGGAVDDAALAHAPQGAAVRAEERERVLDPGHAAALVGADEVGVDEGDIVKMHGQHLVVLRRGRLFRPTQVVVVFRPGP